jgi:hypothetical protein
LPSDGKNPDFSPSETGQRRFAYYSLSNEPVLSDCNETLL